MLKKNPEGYAPFLFSAANIKVMTPIEEHDHRNIPTDFMVMCSNTESTVRLIFNGRSDRYLYPYLYSDTG